MLDQRIDVRTEQNQLAVGFWSIDVTVEHSLLNFLLRVD